MLKSLLKTSNKELGVVGAHFNPSPGGGGRPGLRGLHWISRETSLGAGDMAEE